MSKRNIIIILLTCLFAISIISLSVYSYLNKKFTVYFDSTGGTNIQSQIVKRNGTVQEPTQPERSGYTFLGWYYISDIDKEFDFNTRISNNTILIAKWKKNAELTEFKIVADTNEMSINDEITLNLLLIPEEANIRDYEVIWTSSDIKKATVDNNGKVKALKSGKVTITAKINELLASIDIVIKNTTNKAKSKVINNTEQNNIPVNNNTYNAQWVKIDTSVIGQYYLYIVNSEGTRVSGTATIITKTGASETVSIPSTGKIYVKDTISNVTNIQAN